MTRLSSLVPRLCAGFVLAATAASVSAQSFAIPAKQVDVIGGRYLKVSLKRIYLSPTNLEVMNWGKITAVTSTSALQTLSGASNSTQRSTMEVASAADVAKLRATSGALYEDLAAKLRAAGWEVITYDQAKSTPALVNAKHEPEEPSLGAPVRKVSLGKQKTHYTIANPVGMPAFEWGMMMPFWAIRPIFKELNTNVLEATYRFEPVALQAESKRGLTRNSANTSADATLVLSHALGFFLDHRGAGGSVRLKNPLPVATGIGEIQKASDASPHAANAISETLSKFIGGGAITAKKGLYVAQLDQAALNANLLLAGKAWNDEIVKALSGAQ